MTSVTLAWGAHTDKGLRRFVNEDALVAEYPIFLVADGMGGHDSGEIASERALDAFRPLLGREAVSIDEFETAFREAVLSVDHIATQGMAAGTTISGVAVSEQGGSTYWLVINIGDSRTYRLAGGLFEQISIDHSRVQELLDRGQISAAEAEAHPQRNLITKAVGAGSRAEPDYWLLPANAGDRLLVCSDGLSRELDTVHIETALRQEAAPADAATRLVHEALLHGGSDNVSVIVIDAQAVFDQDAATVPLRSALPPGANEANRGPIRQPLLDRTIPTPVIDPPTVPTAQARQTEEHQHGEV